MNKDVLYQVIVLFLVMGVGMLARKKKIINDETKKGLTDLLLKIILPCTIIASFNQESSSDMLMKGSLIFIFSVCTHLISYCIGKIIYFKYPDDKKSVLRYLTVFSNASFMGYPVLGALYGATGILYVTIYSIPARIFTWTLGVMLFTKNNGSKSDKFKQIFLNPALIAVIIGMVPFLLPIKLPIVVHKTLTMIGDMTSPLSLLLVGVSLADINTKDIFEGGIFYGSFIRLIMIPIATLTILKKLGIGGDVLGSIVILTAMPAASFTAILAGKFNANEIFASKCVFITTLLSIITIPIIVSLI